LKDAKGVSPHVWQQIQCPCPGLPENFYRGFYPQQAIMDKLQKCGLMYSYFIEHRR